MSAALAIGLFSLVLFVPALGAGFTSDDFSILALVRQRGGLEDPASYFRLAFYDYYRPVVFLSHALDWSLWGPDPRLFHATNVALHALNAVAVFFLARRLSGRVASLLAALLFAVHPTNQETVFWVSGRFDLLATAALLSAFWFLEQERRWSYWIGVGLFAVALLSKESGIALLLMAPAYDVLIARRGLPQTFVRLAPLLAVTVVYVALRSAAAGLSATGGLHRSGKVAMLASGVLAVLWIAYRDRAGPRADAAPASLRSSWRAVLVFLLAAGAVLFALGSRTPLGPTLGFAWYAAYFLGPLAWIPPGRLVSPGSASYLALGILMLLLAAGALLWNRGRWRSRPAVVFAWTVVAAALLPVSAMPSRNHLYLGTAGAALLLSASLRDVRRWAFAGTVLAVLVAVGGAEAVMASRDWRRAGAMTKSAIALIGAGLEPCGTRDVVLLIAPANVRGVPCNINDDAFRESLGCAPGQLRSLLRVVGGDVTATPSVSGNRVRFFVPSYRGNLVGTTDLRHFVVQFPAGHAADIDTPIGRLTSWPEGTAQVFEIALAAEARGLALYYYSDGAVSRVEVPGAVR